MRPLIPWALAASFIVLLLVGLIAIQPAQAPKVRVENSREVFAIHAVCPTALPLPSWVHSVPASSQVNLGGGFVGYLGGPRGQQAVIGSVHGWRLQGQGFQLATVDNNPFADIASTAWPGHGVWALLSSADGYRVEAAWIENGRCRSVVARTPTLGGQALMAAVVAAVPEYPNVRRFAVSCQATTQSFVCQAHPVRDSTARG